MIRTGDKVSVESNKKGIREGVVNYQNDSFITVQFKHFRESFLLVDINSGVVKMHKLHE